jgi:hypothetical protein
MTGRRRSYDIYCEQAEVAGRKLRGEFKLTPCKRSSNKDKERH